MPKGYSKIKRKDIKDLIQKEYGLKVTNIYENDKKILLYTNKGNKTFRKVKKQESQLLFAASAYEYLIVRGFKNITKINRTLSDKCYVEYNNSLYILQDAIKGKLLSITSPKEAMLAAKTLAQFHEKAQGFIPAPGSRANVEWGKWMDKFKAHAIRLKKYKEIAMSKKDPGKFDKLFLEHIDEFHDRMYKAYSLMRNNKYLEKVREAMQCNQLAHKCYRKHSLVLTENGELYVSGLENCSYDNREADFASLMESMSGKRKAEMLLAALKAYREVLDFDNYSLKIAFAFFIEPKRFFRAADSYYGKKKDYNESELLAKLERAIRKENKKNEIISLLEEVE